MNALAPFFSVLSPAWAVTNAVARVALTPSARRLPCPVISVGNIVAGGVGKTEIAAAIAARLVRQGLRTVVASRGYGSDWQSKGAVAADAETAQSLKFPDEAIVVLRRAPGTAVAVGADRRAVLARYWEELRPDAVILDDGLQHFAIARDLDVVVHDFGVKWPILRDLPRALARAGVRIAFSEVPAPWRKRCDWVRARYRLGQAVDAHGSRRPLPPRALAFCGIGNPSRFFRSFGFRDFGGTVEVAGTRAFADHHAYSERDVRALADWSARQGLPLLTTLKDYVKLLPYVGSNGGISGFEPLWVELTLEFLENGELLWSAVDKAVGR